MNRITKEFYKQPEVIQSNIEEIWQQYTLKDYSLGRNWYKEANKFSLELAERFSVTPVVSAGVIAALSPQKEWNINKQIAKDAFIFMKKAPSSGWKKIPHVYTQQYKTMKIIKMKNPFIDEVSNILNGLKTKEFFRSIQNPLQCDAVCVDRHMIAIALGSYKQKLTRKQYLFVKQQYLNFAEGTKMIPCEVQAILWVTYKRIKKI